MSQSTISCWRSRVEMITTSLINYACWCHAMTSRFVIEFNFYSGQQVGFPIHTKKNLIFFSVKLREQKRKKKKRSWSNIDIGRWTLIGSRSLMMKLDAGCYRALVWRVHWTTPPAASRIPMCVNTRIEQETVYCSVFFVISHLLCFSRFFWRKEMANE